MILLDIDVASTFIVILPTYINCECGICRRHLTTVQKFLKLQMHMQFSSAI